MKIASIDIGSNTVILLIVEIKDNNILSEKNYFRIGKLGKNLTKGGLISTEKIGILFQIIEEFFTIIKKNICDEILITATNALRIAANGNEIANFIFNNYGIKVDIIPGYLEAEYSFIGASFNYSNNNMDNLIIDIGGGSTEIIIGNTKEILFKKSFQIGTVSLTDKFINGEKPNTDEVFSMENFARKSFSELSQYSNWDLSAIGVGGTPTSLSGMLNKIFVYDENKIEGAVIHKKELNNLSSALSKLTSSEILEKYKTMVEGRNDVIFASSLILKNLLEILKLNEIIVSGKGLRYGVVYSKFLFDRKH